MSRIVLVVEDNPTEQYVLKQLIEKFDFQAQPVSTGEDAISALGRAKYAAILMDITLPGMDGLECTRRIRQIEQETGKRTAVIALTARSSEADHDLCLAAGCDGYISKPFNPEDLRKMLLRYAYDASQPNLKTLTPLRPDELAEVRLNSLEA